LFLGPTGVGKTETAKALAETYFGNENAMMRLNMNEYKEDSSIERLIGAFESGKPGVLSSMIRDKKYGVLLLDEFEKASKNVPPPSKRRGRQVLPTRCHAFNVAVKFPLFARPLEFG